MAYATQDDLETRFPRDLTTAESNSVDTLLDDASFWLDVWVVGLADSTDETVLMAAKLLVVAMVKRSLLSQMPEDPGVEMVTQEAGPFTRTVRYRNPDGNLYLYARELEDLLSLLRDNRADAVSMRSPGL